MSNRIPPPRAWPWDLIIVSVLGVAYLAAGVLCYHSAGYGFSESKAPATVTVGLPLLFTIIGLRLVYGLFTVRWLRVAYAVLAVAVLWIGIAIHVEVFRSGSSEAFIAIGVQFTLLFIGTVLAILVGVGHRLITKSSPRDARAE